MGWGGGVGGGLAVYPANLNHMDFFVTADLSDSDITVYPGSPFNSSAR